jgi:hypothetical protein
MVSAGEAKAWEIETGQRPYGLQVVKLKRIFVLPWAQFLYAEGTREEVKAVFSTHDVVIKGSDLASLLSDFAAQRITVLKEPARTDQFASLDGARITALEVHQIETPGPE